MTQKMLEAFLLYSESKCNKNSNHSPDRVQKYGGRVDVTEDLNETVQAAEDRRRAERQQDEDNKRLKQRTELLKDFQQASLSR
jgi:hypothetical protein